MDDDEKYKFVESELYKYSFVELCRIETLLHNGEPFKSTSIYKGYKSDEIFWELFQKVINKKEKLNAIKKL